MSTRFTAVTEEELARVAGGIELEWDGSVPDPSYATDPNQNPNWWSPWEGWDSYPDQDGIEQGGYAFV
jgi:hypothetical protein